MRVETQFREATAGVKFSGMLLVICGICLGFSAIGGLLVASVLTYERHARPGLHVWIPFLIYCAVLAASAWACLRAAVGLYQMRNRSRIAGAGIGLFALVLGAWILLDVFLPARPGSFHGDDGFAVLMTPFFILPGAWLSVYLNLPHVMKRFRQIPSA